MRMQRETNLIKDAYAQGRTRKEARMLVERICSTRAKTAKTLVHRVYNELDK